jgi:hypothetical protein
MDCDDSTSRRGWVLTLARTALALGFDGRDAFANTTEELPPGLYAPSTDHLGHALMDSGPFRIVPPRCPTDYVRPAGGPFEPRFFSPHDFAVIRRIVELLLGEDAAAQEASEWVDLCVSSAAAIRESALHLDASQRALAVAYSGPASVAEMETFKPEAICHAGLQWLDAAAKNQYGRAFADVEKSNQLALVNSISDEHNTDMRANAGTRFFSYLKGEVIRGFYTSRAGLKELDFKGNTFYARSPGCPAR